MEFYDVLQNRHSIRKFTDKPVEATKIKNIINAAVRAPSAGNLQAYRICLVRTQEVKEALLPAIEYQEFVVQVPLLMVFVAHPPTSEAKYGQRGFELYAPQDATISASYAQLAATAEGLSSVWVGSFDSLEVSRILHLLSYEVPIAILAIGYPNGPIESTTRKPIKEIVREI